MVSWRYPDTTKRVRVAFVCPTGSDPASSVAGTSYPITPDVMITRCSAAYFLVWVRRNFTITILYVFDTMGLIEKFVIGCHNPLNVGCEVMECTATLLYHRSGVPPLPLSMPCTWPVGSCLSL